MSICNMKWRTHEKVQGKPLMVASSFEQIYNELLEQLVAEAWLDQHDPVMWPWRIQRRSLEKV